MTHRPRLAPRFAALLPLLALLATPAGATDVLVPFGATWSYRDDGVDPGSAWRLPGFDASGWASGPAELGYGDGDEATVVGFGGDPANVHVSTWFRAELTVAAPGSYLSLELRLLRDDGAVVWLNGTEVVRSNLPAGAIDATTLAVLSIDGSQEDDVHRFAVDPGLLVAGTNVLAVEVHQQSVTSPDVSFDLELRGETSVVAMRGPWLQLGTATSTTFRWRTNVPTDSRVWLGTAPGSLAVAATDPTLVLEHEVTVAGLAPDTSYAYAVGSSAGVVSGDDAGHVFRTAPVPGTARPTRVWVLGDSGTASAAARSVRDAYAAWAGSAPTHLWLMLGDNAYTHGTDDQYQEAVFETFPDMLRRAVLWPARGNHEVDPAVHYGAFTLPAAGEAGGVPSGTEAYWSFDHANVHFVCLDSQGSDRSVGGAMWTWLEADLGATDQDWIVAFWHHPPYSKGTHDSDWETELIDMRASFLPLLEDHGVDLVLCGHSHGYERSVLLDGHYGVSTTLVPSMVLDAGDGRVDGDGAYARVAGPHAGAVYVVAGSSGLVGPAPFGHPAMLLSLAQLGSLVLDVDGDELTVTFLRADATEGDRFTLTFSGTGACFGDGSGPPCPCGNESSTPGEGCVHSGGRGMTIVGTGTTSVAADNLGMVASGCPLANTGLFFAARTPLGAPSPLYDGLQCAGGEARRFRGLFQVSGEVADTDFVAQDPSGTFFLPGLSCSFQYWTRDVQAGPSPCGTGASFSPAFVVTPSP